MRYWVIIFILFCKINLWGQSKKGFYIMGDLGFQPYSSLSLSDIAITDSPNESGSIVLGLQPSFQFNDYVHGSIFYTFEGHSSPIPITSAIGLKGSYFYNGRLKSPLTTLGLGIGTNGDVENGSNGIYGSLDFGYQFVNGKEKPSRVLLGYSLQNANDYDYSPNSLSGVVTDATTHSVKVSFSMSIGRSRGLKE